MMKGVPTNNFPPRTFQADGSLMDESSIVGKNIWFLKVRSNSDHVMTFTFMDSSSQFLFSLGNKMHLFM